MLWWFTVTLQKVNQPAFICRRRFGFLGLKAAIAYPLVRMAYSYSTARLSTFWISLGEATPGNVILRFDYKQLADGKIINKGTEYCLVEDDWLIDKSPYVENQSPTPDELDYALLRVDGVPGEEQIGEKPDPNSPQRGWIKLPTEPYYEFLPDSPLLIVQHPNAQPLKLAFDTDAIISINENGTIVKYNTNTEPGSSGSPCFDINWNLIALHHSGDPDWNPTYNAGTPFSAICSRLDKQGLLADLRSGKPVY